MLENTNSDKLYVQRIYPYNLKRLYCVSKILNNCGKNMARLYGLQHWNNSMLKSLIIVCLSVLKNKIYLVLQSNIPVATYQLSIREGLLCFEKLAVNPAYEGKGYGAYCINQIEAEAAFLGLKKVQMSVYSLSENAIGFYEHLNYRKVGQNKTLKYTEILMEKDLN